MSDCRSAIGKGHVMHRRAFPRVHVLNVSYPVVRLDLTELKRLNQDLKLFSVDGPNFISLRPSDYGDGKSGTIDEFVRTQMHELGSAADIARVELVTYPRVCGFAFNPISCFLCRDAEDDLIGVIFEVNSTFGQRCHYSFLVADPGSETHLFTARKVMQVSPFNRIEGEYFFRLSDSRDGFQLVIQYQTQKGSVLSTSLKAQWEPLSDRKLVSHFGLLPISMFGTLFSIHWNAVLLWFKGVPFVGSASVKAQETKRNIRHV